MTDFDETHSVTRWIEDLKDGSDEAADHLWQRYFEQLKAQAKKRLGNAPRRIADEEDVALSVFQALCAGASDGRFDQLSNRGDLWKLLVVITKLKSVNQIRHQTAQKRGGKSVGGHSRLASINQDDLNGFDRFVGDEPTPEFLVSMQEEQTNLIGSLDDETQQKIVHLRLAGHTNNTIADMINVSVRTVERKLNLIRKQWLKVLTEVELASL